METSLFSQSWYRVAGMKPMLRRHVRIHRHIYRGKIWYVMQDDSTGKFHRFSPEAYFIIGLMDGRHTLGTIWETACQRLGDDMPTQDEVVTLLTQLYQADALQSDLEQDVGDLFRRFADEKKNRRMNLLRSPTSIKIPLFDPDRLLNTLAPLGRLLFSTAGALIWLAVVVPALFLTVAHWDEMTSGMADRLFGMENLLLVGCVYPVLKLFHEFGHALAVKRWGEEVHEMGVMFLVFVPMPYVDASASTAFSDKRKRMVVGGAGILVELFAAALAVWVWVTVEPGAVRAVAYNVMIIAGVSTLFFNGNPLLKFDAYYVFSDWLEIPNLSTRSTQYLGYLTKRYLLRLGEAVSPVTAPGERRWLGGYAVLSFAYRLFISFRIIILVAGRYFVVGVFLALWTAISMVVLPIAGVVKQIAPGGALAREKRRIAIASVALLTLLAIALLMVPFPLMTVAQGVTWPPGKSGVHAGSDGFVTAANGRQGQRVEGGATLFVCEDRALDAEVAVLSARVEAVAARHRETVLTDRIEAAILKDEMAHLQEALSRALERQRELIIRSPASGQFFLERSGEMVGRYVRRGERLGYVVDFSKAIVRVVITQDEVDRVRNDVRALSVRLVGAVDRVVGARLQRIVPAASRELPSLALSLEGGGEIALDPRATQSPTAFQTLFQLDIELAEPVARRIGERVYVRFEHAPEPLFFRLFRGARRLLLTRFEV